MTNIRRWRLTSVITLLPMISFIIYVYFLFFLFPIFLFYAFLICKIGIIKHLFCFFSTLMSYHSFSFFWWLFKNIFNHYVLFQPMKVLEFIQSFHSFGHLECLKNVAHYMSIHICLHYRQKWIYFSDFFLGIDS